MIFNISVADYALTGLGDCCSLEPVTTANACVVAFDTGTTTCPAGTTATGGTGIYACSVSTSGPIGGQPDCTGLFAGSTFFPTNSTAQYVPNGSCTIEVTAEPGCGCPNSLPITQSIDVCTLAASAYAQLGRETLNMFGSPCVA